jgi:DNA-binding GntR family transcriptional regulator
MFEDNDIALGESALPLPELVYRKLRVGILDGSLRPGMSLRQEEIARQLKVSRVPVREAMSRLETDGLIVLRPRRGYAVTELEQEEMVEIFELRMVIEEHAAVIAARARTRQDVAEVEELLLQMETLASTSKDHSAEWSRINRQFHARIVSSSHRKRLSGIAETLRDAVEFYVSMEMRLTGSVDDALREHREIFQAFKAGDVDGLARLSRAHVQSTARRLLDGLHRKNASMASL